VRVVVRPAGGFSEVAVLAREDGEDGGGVATGVAEPPAAVWVDGRVADPEPGGKLSRGNSLPTGGGGGRRVLRSGGELPPVEGVWEDGDKGGGLAVPWDDPDGPNGEGETELVGGGVGLAGRGAGGKDGTGITVVPGGGNGAVDPGADPGIVESGGMDPGVRASAGDAIGSGAEGCRPTPIT
jgi:hypothetical protein